jgi:hypothetical protein
MSKEGAFTNDEYEMFTEQIEATETTLDDLLRLIPLFKDEEEYLGLDTTLKQVIEKKPNYPSIELFTLEAHNDLQTLLIQRCFNSQLIHDAPNIHAAYEIIHADMQQSNDDVLKERLISQLPHLNDQEKYLVNAYVALLLD